MSANFKVFHTFTVLKLNVNVHKLNEGNCKNATSDQGLTVLVSSLMPAFTERRPHLVQTRADRPITRPLPNFSNTP